MNENPSKKPMSIKKDFSQLPLQIVNQYTGLPNPYSGLPTFYPYSYPTVGPPTIIKNNNITIRDNDISGVFYEDIMPKNSHDFNCSAVSERMTLYKYILENLVDKQEGEKACLKSDRFKSLLKHFKIINPLPENNSLKNINPWKKLPPHLELYHICYPLTESVYGSSQCKEGSWGLQLRKYKIPPWESNPTDNSISISKANSTTWRDINFYKFIREKIVKKKVCPNFVLMYTYFICPESEDLLSKPKREKVYMQINNPPIPPMLTNPAEIIRIGGYDSILMMTEGSMYSLDEWMTNRYKYTGGNKIVQVSSSIKPPEVWQSILFMIFSAMYTLEVNNIYIPQFGKNNIYIRDLIIQGYNSGYWIYKIDGIEFFVINYGYLPLIDVDPTEIVPDEFVNTICDNIEKIGIDNKRKYRDGYKNLFKCYCNQIFHDDITVINDLKNNNSMIGSLIQNNGFKTGNNFNVTIPEEILQKIYKIDSDMVVIKLVTVLMIYTFILIIYF